MLPLSNRLPHTQRIVSGKSLSTATFILKYAPNANSGYRFGIVISKKVDKSAVARNRMRRLLHQFIQTHLEEFAPQHDYVFIIKSQFSELNVKVAQDLEQALRVSKS